MYMLVYEHISQHITNILAKLFQLPGWGALRPGSTVRMKHEQTHCCKGGWWLPTKWSRVSTNRNRQESTRKYPQLF